jgi:hypothetical protein
MDEYINESHLGKDLDQITPVWKLPPIKRKTAHQVLVDAILEASGQDNKHYKFWIGMISRSKKSMNEILYICDKAKTLPEKYNRGGFIRNRLL